MIQTQFAFGAVVALAMASGIVSAQVAPTPTPQPSLAAAYVPDLTARCANERDWLIAEANSAGILRSLALEALESCVWREAQAATQSAPLRAGR